MEAGTIQERSTIQPEQPARERAGHRSFDPDLPEDKRAELRTQLLAETPGWYFPLAHLLAPTIFGLSVCVLAAFRLEGVAWWEWFAVPTSWIFANLVEWHAHRDLLHKRQPWMPVLYERHTPTHHQVFVSHDMPVQDRREWRQVLMPAYAVALIVMALFPVSGAIWLLGLPNVALLYLMTGTGYVLSYEWLHLSYHLAPESWIGRRRTVRFLGRHHAVHHAPSLMRSWNMNVTVPFWDWIRGTVADRMTSDEVLAGPQRIPAAD